MSQLDLQHIEVGLNERRGHVIALHFEGAQDLPVQSQRHIVLIQPLLGQGHVQRRPGHVVRLAPLFNARQGLLVAGRTRA